MSTPNDGGPAFPHVAKVTMTMDGTIISEPLSCGVMSMRDWFARQATPAIMRDPRYSDVGNEAANLYEVARASYKLADAMLLARKGTP